MAVTRGRVENVSACCLADDNKDCRLFLEQEGEGGGEGSL